MTFCIVKRFVTDRKPQPYTCRNPNMSILVGGRGVDCNYTTQNFTQKIKRISIQMLKKNCHLVLGFGVTKIETRAHFQNNRCKQPTSRPPPQKDRVNRNRTQVTLSLLESSAWQINHSPYNWYHLHSNKFNIGIPC